MRRLALTCAAAAVLCAMTAAPADAARAHASIVAGATVPISSYPYQVRVVIRASSGTYSCGGSIRDSTHVVTAAHCVDIDGLARPANVTVGYGSASTSSLASAAVSEVTIPAKYQTDDSYDVALLDLAAPLSNFNTSTVKAIPLATASSLTTGVAAEANAFATGWGLTSENGAGSSALRGVALPLRADSVCTSTYGSGYVGSRTVCAGGKGTAATGNPDTCQGDSGGPLALDSGQGNELVAVTSYGNGCGRRLVPAAYTEISNSEINAVVTGTAPASATLRGSQQAATPTAVTAPAPVASAPAVPAPTPVLADTSRPSAAVSALRCKRTRCTFRLRASDPGGSVRGLSVRLARKVTTCRTRGKVRSCTTRTRTRKLTVKRTTSGFSGTAKLTPARYELTAVATDTSGNRSKVTRRSFRVRR